MRSISHLTTLVALLALAALCCCLGIGVGNAQAYKWFVRESAGVHEHELSGTLPLKIHTFSGKINLYLELINGSEKQIMLADGCNKSELKGISLVGGTPGKVEIERLTISGCEEALTEPCTVASSSETATIEHLDGDLVGGPAATVAVLFESKEFSLGVKCGSKTGTEKIKSEFLPGVGPYLSFAPLTEQKYSRLQQYLNSKEEAVDPQSEVSGPVCANMASYEATLLLEPEGTSEEKEIKVE